MNKTQKSRQVYFPRNILTIVLLISFLLMLLPENIRELLYLNIIDSKEGDYWRIISGHLIHHSWSHWVVNCVGLIAYLLFFRQQKKWPLLFALFFLMLFISIGLLLFSQELKWYLGFSGVLTGLFIYSAVTNFQEEKFFMSIILVILLVYTGYQLSQGELVKSSLYVISTSSYAHALGLLGGILSAIIDITIRLLLLKSK